MTELLGSSQKERKKQRTVQEFMSEQQHERWWEPQAMDSDGKQERDMPKKISNADSSQQMVVQQVQRQHNEIDCQANDPQNSPRQRSEDQ